MNTTFITEQPRADLIKREFDTLIHQKGRGVLLETALQCPCKSPSSGQQSNCNNCGGTGWIFVNPRETRMVLTAISTVTEFRPWSEELRGTVNITTHVEDELSIMDRITALSGESIHNEVLFIKAKATQRFTYCTYNVKKSLYIGLFQGINQPLIKLVEGVDYTVVKNAIKFEDTLEFPFEAIEDNSITIRYKHAPQFHVIEMKRDTMQTFNWEGKEVDQNMPTSAIARRAHYQLSAQNLSGDRLLDNSYT